MGLFQVKDFPGRWGLAIRLLIGIYGLGMSPVGGFDFEKAEKRAEERDKPPKVNGEGQAPPAHPPCPHCRATFLIRCPLHGTKPPFLKEGQSPEGVCPQCRGTGEVPCQACKGKKEVQAGWTEAYLKWTGKAEEMVAAAKAFNEEEDPQALQVPLTGYAAPHFSFWAFYINCSGHSLFGSEDGKRRIQGFFLKEKKKIKKNLWIRRYEG